MRRVELDLNKMQSEEEIHRYLKEQMDFSEYYGENLDALYDMLTELPENICVELLRCQDAGSPIFEFGKKLERVMEDAAQTVDYTEDGKMYAVFADLTPLGVGGAW